MTATISPESVIRKVKTIGKFGPIYQVIKELYKKDDGDTMMQVVLVESNETIEYPLSNIEVDPEAE